MLESEVLKFFPEPVFKYKFEKAEFFNNKLAQYIYDLQKEDLNGLTKSNRGGWHSRDFKLTDQNSIQFKFALELQKYIFDTFQKFGFEAVDTRHVERVIENRSTGAQMTRIWIHGSFKYVG